MKAIIGLGNPGDKYALTRHNIGFEVIDYLALQYQITFKSSLKALIGTTHIDSQKVLFVKPQTYMNVSGESALDIVNYYDLDLDEILIIYDDIDIDLGKVRIRQKGSAGTHNGMRSIVECLQSQEMPRIRMGIGKPEEIPLVNYVLQRFTPSEIPVVREMVTKAGDAVTCFINEGINLCMNKYNR